MSHAAVLVAVEGDIRNIEKLVAEQMRPFDENDECFRAGSRWDWWKIGGRYSGFLSGVGDVVRRSELSLDRILAENRKRAVRWWTEAQAESEIVRGMAYGIRKDDTIESYLARGESMSFFAFLRNWQWHENERLGWFGGTAKTECEIAAKEAIEGKCLHQQVIDGKIARVIAWGEPDERWKEKYWGRFVEPLDPNTILALVDYHV